MRAPHNKLEYKMGIIFYEWIPPIESCKGVRSFYNDSDSMERISYSFEYIWNVTVFCEDSYQKRGKKGKRGEF